MVQLLSDPLRMDKRTISKRILDFTLEIIYLLTGEDYTLVKKTSGECVAPSGRPCVSGGWRRGHIPESPNSLIPESNNEKILELTNKMMELLSGEVPIRCQDVAVYLSMEEWEYIEGHRDLYPDVMMENPGPLTPADGSRNPAEKCPSPELCPEESPGVPEDLLVDGAEVSGEDLIDIKVEVVDDEVEMYMMAEQHGSSRRNPAEGSPLYLKDYLENHEGEDPSYMKVKVKSEYEDEMRSGGEWREEDTTANVGRDNYRKNLAGDFVICPKLQVEVEENGHHSKVENFMTDNGYLEHHRSHQSSDHKKPCPDPSQVVHPNTSQGRGKIFECGECGKQFTKNANLFTHRRVHTGEKPYACSECGKCFARKTGLNQHKRIHTGQKPFTCSECGKSFNQKSFLVKHQITHTGEKPFSCSECGKCFSQKAHLVQHHRTHTGEKPFACPECDKCFTAKAKLREHQILHSGNKPFTCSECDKSFTSKTKLRTHQRSHTGEKPFGCSECGKCFAQRSSLVEHGRLHTGEKPYSCLECGLCFITKAKLRDHQRSHTGEKPFVCSVCGKCFIQKSYLVDHQRLHSETKPYSCPECGKGFIKKSRLVYHSRFHSGEKPFSCLQCGRLFAQKSDLVKHQKIHTGEKPFSCSECGKCFSKKSNFFDHLEIHLRKKPFVCS